MSAFTAPPFSAAGPVTPHASEEPASLTVQSRVEVWSVDPRPGMMADWSWRRGGLVWLTRLQWRGRGCKDDMSCRPILERELHIDGSISIDERQGQEGKIFQLWGDLLAIGLCLSFAFAGLSPFLPIHINLPIDIMRCEGE